MVIKIHAPHPSTAGTLAYNDRKVEAGVARVVGTLSAGSPREAAREMERRERLNVRTERVSLQLSVNPDPDRPGESLTDAEAMGLAQELLSRLGYFGQPAIVYEHRDTRRTHYHVVSTRVNGLGRKVDDSFERKRLQEAMRDLSERFHFTVGNEGEREAPGEGERRDAGEGRARRRKDPAGGLPRFDPKAGDVRAQLAAITAEAMRWRYTTLTQFQTILRAMGVKADPVEGESRRLILQGLDARDRKASPRIGQDELGTDLYARCEARAAECRDPRTETEGERRKRLADRRRCGATVAFCLAHSRSERHLERMLAKCGITMTLSRGADGTIFGTTFADARSRTAYKGSELGKGCALSLFREADDPETGRWAEERAKAQRRATDRTVERALDEAAAQPPQTDTPDGPYTEEWEEVSDLDLSILEGFGSTLAAFADDRPVGTDPGKRKKRRKKLPPGPPR